MHSKVRHLDIGVLFLQFNIYFIFNADVNKLGVQEQVDERNKETIIKST